MLSVDFSVVIQIANFLILLFILNIVLFKPIRKILGTRNEEMRSIREMIEDFRGKFDQRGKKLLENRIEANAAGKREREVLKGECLEKEKGILQGATSSAEDQIGKAREEIQEKIVGVRKSLESEVELFSKELVERILGRSV